MATFLEQLQPCTVFDAVNECVLNELIHCRPRLVLAVGFSCKDNRYYQQDLLKALKDYQLKPINKKHGGRKTVYSFSKGKRIGRLNADGFSLQTCHRPIRHALTHGVLRDVDVENCHPEMLLQLAKKWDVNLKKLEEYVSAREEKLALLMEHCDCDRDAAKNVVLRVMYGGQPAIDDKVFDLPWLDTLQDEMKVMHEAVAERFPTIFEEQQALYANDPEFKTPKAKRAKALRSTAALAMQSLECGVLKVMHDYCLERELEPRVLAHDGLMVKHAGIPVDFFTSLNAQILEKTGFFLKVVEKDIAAPDWKALEKKHFTPAFLQSELDAVAGKRKAAEITPEAIPEAAAVPDVLQWESLAMDGELGLALLMKELHGGNLVNIAGDKMQAEFYVIDATTNIWNPKRQSDLMAYEIPKLRAIVDELLAIFIKKYEELEERIDAFLNRGAVAPSELFARKKVLEGKVFELRGQIRTLTSARGLGAVSSLVYATCRNTEYRQKLDSDPYILSVRNGVVDLRTGELRPRQRDDFCTYALEHDFEPQHNGLHMIEDFMQEIMLAGKERLNRPELYELLHRVIGYTITGLDVEQLMFFLVGEGGANGKGTIVRLLKKLLGPRLFKICQNTIIMAAKQQRQAGGTSSDLARLEGARAACVPEMKNATIDDQAYKTFCGGDDVNARKLFGEEFSFVMTCKMLLCMNSMPVFEDCSGPVIRRLFTIPFDMQARDKGDDLQPFNPDDPTHVIKDRYKEASLPVGAFLTWAVQGSVKYFAGGIGELPECCKTLRNRVIACNDTVQEWLDARGELDGGVAEEEETAHSGGRYYWRCASAYESYKEFLSKKQPPRKGPTMLKDMHKLMEERGFTKLNSNRRYDSTKGHIVYVGCRMQGGC